MFKIQTKKMKKYKFNLYSNSEEYKWFKRVSYFSLVLIFLGILAKCPKDYALCIWISRFYPEPDLIMGFAFAIIVNYMFYMRTVLAENINKDFLLTEIIRKAKFIFIRSIFISELIDNYVKEDDKLFGIKHEREIIAEELSDIKSLLVNNFPNIYFEASSTFFTLIMLAKHNKNIKQEKLFFDEISKLEKEFKKIFSDDIALSEILHENDISSVDFLKTAWIVQYPEADFEVITANVTQKLMFGKTTEEILSSLRAVDEGTDNPKGD